MENQNVNTNHWQPPADFEKVTSAMEGITVFAPKPKDEQKETLISFKCPQCGATTRYDVTAGGVACEHCGYTRPVETEQVGKKAKENEFTLENLKKAEHGWGEERRVLHCGSCGSEIAVASEALATTCAFCASNKVNLLPPDVDVLRPRFLVPFKVTPESNRDRARVWLGEGWFHPGELAASAIIEHFIGIMTPQWTFDANITAFWKAEVGYEHNESYYDHHDKTWKTRTVIRWRWENGQVNLDIDDLIVPGSSHISNRLFQKILPFNLNELVNYNAGYLAGWQAQAYNINLLDAWEKGKGTMRELAKNACYKDIPSSHVRNFSMQADFSNESWRYILLPIYIAAYRFEDKVYQVLVNGQTGVIAGQKPVAWWKIWLAIAALLAPGILLGLIGLPLLLAGGVGTLPLFLGFILLIVGGAISFNIFRKARDSEAV